MSTLTSDRAIDAANLLATIADEFLYACLLLTLGEMNRYLHVCRVFMARPGIDEARLRLEAVRNLIAQARPEQTDALDSLEASRKFPRSQYHRVELPFTRAQLHNTEVGEA